MTDPVSIVKDMYAAFSRGDVPTILSHMSEDVLWEMEAPAKISWSGKRHGKEEAMGFFSGIANDSTDQHLEMTKFIASGDSVAVFGRYQATMKSTGTRVDTPVAHLFEFREGKVAHYMNFVNTAAFTDAM